jgi:CheY-like chemotaxis protein
MSPPPPLVLLVDDDRDTREMYEIGLELAGLRLATAKNGREAIAAATSLLPDTIVTDLSLPDMDGTDLCEQLGADARTAGIRVIVLTGRSQAEDLSRATSAGARRVLIKPCTPDDLAAAIRDVLAEP